MKVELDIDLEKFRYSLIGDGFLKDEVIEMSKDELIAILKNRIINYIDIGCDESFYRLYENFK